MTRIHLILIMAALLLAGTGCSDGYGGGAYQATAVTVLPADLSGKAVESVGDVDTGDLGTSASAGGTGSFAGRVLLSGSVDPLPLLIAEGANVKDRAVCSAQAVPDERLVLGADNSVANVFIFIKRVPKGTPKPTPSDEPVIFDQDNCHFLPHCLIVPVGQTIKVLSGDAVAHNTHTYPKRNSGVSTGVAANDRDGKLEIVYRAAEREPLLVTCDFHSWMKAWHFPVDHPFVDLTDADGNFEINDLPAGDHVFTVWHEATKGRLVSRNLQVTIRPGDTTRQDINYPVSQLEL